MMKFRPLVTQIARFIENRAAWRALHQVLPIVISMINLKTSIRNRIRRSNHFCLSVMLVWFAGSVNGPVQATVATATVTTNVILTIGITTQNGLSFGDISAGATAGTIVLSPTGTRTATGGSTFSSGVAGSPAAFDVQGNSNATYSISLPGSVVLTDSSSNNMVVDNFTSSPTPTGVLDGSGQQTLLVGATLNVGSNQAFGSYSGIMSVTVVYN